MTEDEYDKKFASQRLRSVAEGDVSTPSVRMVLSETDQTLNDALMTARRILGAIRRPEPQSEGAGGKRPEPSCLTDQVQNNLQVAYALNGLLMQIEGAL